MPQLLDSREFNPCYATPRKDIFGSLRFCFLAISEDIAAFRFKVLNKGVPEAVLYNTETTILKLF